MKFDDSEHPCPDLVNIAKDVFTAIPEPDRALIDSVCEVVVFWRGGDRDTLAAFDPKERRIQVVVPHLLDSDRGCSEAGQRGIFAHEFGHAYDYALRRISPERNDKERAERSANEHLERWGFANDFRVAHAEHGSAFGLIGLNTQSDLS